MGRFENWKIGKLEKGFTLIEVLVYATLFVIIGGVVSAFFIQITNVAEGTRRSREALDSARRAMNVVTQEIRHATAVYTPTSDFVNNPGQLSLETTRDLPAQENTTYVDFYVDDEGIYIKRESQTEELITSEKVRVTSLSFTHLNGTSSGEAVQINLTVEYIDPTTGPALPVNLVATASLRSY